jgi:hypothetical protein
VSPPTPSDAYTAPPEPVASPCRTWATCSTRGAGGRTGVVPVGPPHPYATMRPALANAREARIVKVLSVALPPAAGSTDELHVLRSSVCALVLADIPHVAEIFRRPEGRSRAKGQSRAPCRPESDPGDAPFRAVGRCGDHFTLIGRKSSVVVALRSHGHRSFTTSPESAARAAPRSAAGCRRTGGAG